MKNDKIAMRTIGLLGGMNFDVSAANYRLINEGVRERLGGLNFAGLILQSTTTLSDR